MSDDLLIATKDLIYQTLTIRLKERHRYTPRLKKKFVRMAARHFTEPVEISEFLRKLDTFMQEFEQRYFDA